MEGSKNLADFATEANEELNQEHTDQTGISYNNNESNDGSDPFFSDDFLNSDFWNQDYDQNMGIGEHWLNDNWPNTDSTQPATNAPFPQDQAQAQAVNASTPIHEQAQLPAFTFPASNTTATSSGPVGPFNVPFFPSEGALPKLDENGMPILSQFLMGPDVFNSNAQQDPFIRGNTPGSTDFSTDTEIAVDPAILSPQEAQSPQDTPTPGAESVTSPPQTPISTNTTGRGRGRRGATRTRSSSRGGSARGKGSRNVKSKSASVSSPTPHQQQLQDVPPDQPQQQGNTSNAEAPETWAGQMNLPQGFNMPSGPSSQGNTNNQGQNQNTATVYKAMLEREETMTWHERLARDQKALSEQKQYDPTEHTYDEIALKGEIALGYQPSPAMPMAEDPVTSTLRILTQITEEANRANQMIDDIEYLTTQLEFGAAGNTPGHAEALANIRHHRTTQPEVYLKVSTLERGFQDSNKAHARGLYHQLIGGVTPLTDLQRARFKFLLSWQGAMYTRLRMEVLNNGQRFLIRDQLRSIMKRSGVQPRMEHAFRTGERPLNPFPANKAWMFGVPNGTYGTLVDYTQEMMQLKEMPQPHTPQQQNVNPAMQIPGSQLSPTQLVNQMQQFGMLQGSSAQQMGNQGLNFNMLAGSAQPQSSNQVHQFGLNQGSGLQKTSNQTHQFGVAQGSAQQQPSNQAFQSGNTQGPTQQSMPNMTLPMQTTQNAQQFPSFTSTPPNTNRWSTGQQLPTRVRQNSQTSLGSPRSHSRSNSRSHPYNIAAMARFNAAGQQQGGSRVRRSSGLQNEVRPDSFDGAADEKENECAVGD